MEDQELTKEQKLELEEKAIETLLQYGAKFNVPLKIYPKSAPKRIQWWNKHFPKLAIRWKDSRVDPNWNVDIETVTDISTGGNKDVYMRHFVIRPLYLGTIDFIRALELEIKFDENAIQKEPVAQSEKLFKYTKTMAKIVAVAILNVCDITDPYNDDVPDLQKFLYTHLTCARLQKLCMIIDQLKDRASFTNSIRLILQVEVMTTPKADRVE
jgi:hypothetical protein